MKTTGTYIGRQISLIDELEVIACEIQCSSWHFTLQSNPVGLSFRNMEMMQVHEEADMLASISAPHSKSTLQDAEDELSQLAPGIQPSAQAGRSEAADGDALIIENKVICHG